MKNKNKNKKFLTTFKKFVPFSLDFSHQLLDPNNFFLILGKKKNLNLFLLNPENLKINFKQCFFYFQKSLQLKIAIIFIVRIENEVLLQIFKFFCIKNKLILINLNQKSDLYQYKLFLKKKNIMFINLFLDSNEFSIIQKDTFKYNIPVINFLSLQYSKYNSLASFNGLITYDYIQFLIILTLINIYEKI